MAQNGMFRTALFGGYNREDVEEHIRNMEHEIETVKLLHQKEKLELIRRAEESEGELALVKSELEEAHRQLGAVQPDDAQTDDAQSEDAQQSDKGARLQEGEPAAEKPESETENAKPAGTEEKEALNKLQEELQKERARTESERKTLARLREAQERLEQENQQLRKQLESRDDLFDYETVTKIMEEVRNNAELIEKEARERASQIIQEARDRAVEEGERQRRNISSRINAQLEEKGIQLMAAKYKIEQYIKSINETQQGLCLLNERMGKMVKDMPVRLDDYWESEESFQLEDKGKAGKKLREISDTEE